MRTVLIFSSGFLAGGLILRWLVMLAVRRELKPDEFDAHYRASARAVMRHMGASGTINVAQTGRLLSVDDLTAARYLNRMLRERLLRRHGHQAGEFYTLS